MIKTIFAILAVIATFGPTQANTALQAFAAMPPASAGYGPDAGLPDPRHHAMAYALHASAAVDIGDLAAAQLSARWLIANSNGGWGLGWAWDAFSDGSVNPAGTVYAIETAIAVRALFDVYEATGNAEYASAAGTALDHYSRRMTRTSSGGFFWYSDSEDDAVQVTNISAMLAGQYARSGALLARGDHSILAEAAVNQLLSERRTRPFRGSWWPYGTTRPDANDALHASYVVIGLLDAARYLGKEIDLNTEVDHLLSFIGAKSVREYPLGDVRGAALARAGGIGQLAFVLAEFGRFDDARNALYFLSPYSQQAGLYCYRPSDGCGFPRVQAQVLSGLARLERREREAERRWIKLVDVAAFSPRDSMRTFEFGGYFWMSGGYVTGGVDLRDLWKSQNGSDWSLVSAATPYDPYSSLAAHGGYIWAANWSLWRSLDGVLWERMIENTPFSDAPRNAQARLLTFNGRLWYLGFGSVWSSYDGLAWEQKPSPPYGQRGSYTALVWRDRLWVIGGFRPRSASPPELRYTDRESLNDVWSSADGETWHRITAAAQWTPRYWHAAIVHNDQLYVIGGYDGRNNANLGDVWRTSEGRHWERVSLNAGASPRHFPSVFSRANGILLLAGNAWPVTNDIWRLYLPR